MTAPTLSVYPRSVDELMPEARALVDATDGTMARRVRVKEVLPNFDGRKLDDITDFLTYTFLPLMLIWRARLIPEGTEAWLLLPLLASAYGFSQVEAKTEDGYFLGFPSLWNVVAFYLYALDLPGTLALGIIAVLALLTFVPSRYLYPSSGPGRPARCSIARRPRGRRPSDDRRRRRRAAAACPRHR